MSVYLNSQKIIKDWIDYNDHMNVSYYLLIFDKYGADTLNSIFKMGEHTEKIHVLSSTVEAQEKRIDINHNIINEIHNDISILKTDISYMKNDIHEIKNKLK